MYIFLIILFFSNNLFSSDFYWKKIGSERLLSDVITTGIQSQDSVYIGTYSLTLRDPDFFNLDSYEKRGLAISKNKGYNWEIILEQEWHLDYENFYESLQNKSHSFSIGSIHFNSNHKIFRSLVQGYIVYSDDYGNSWDTTHLGIKNQDGTIDTINRIMLRLDFDNSANYVLSYYGGFQLFFPDLINISYDGGDNWENFNFDYSKLDSDIPEDKVRIGNIQMLDSSTFMFRLYDTNPSFELTKREVHLTSDKGKSWKKINTPNIQNEYNLFIFCYDEETFFLSGDYLHHPEFYDHSHFIYRTTNQGESWDKVFHTDEFPSSFSSFIKLNDGTILARGLYKIFRSTDMGLTWEEDVIEKDSTHQISSFNYDFKNDYAILKGSGSTYWELTTASSVKRAELLHFFSLYPNPAESTSRITLDFHNDLPREIEIYDLLGNLVLSSKPLQSTLEIDISKLSPATYIVKSIYGDQSVSRKFVKK